MVSIRPIIVLSETPKLLHHLRNQSPHLIFDDAITPGTKETVAKLQETEIIVADPNLLIPHLDYLQSVKWIQTTWAGLDLLTPHLKNREIPYRISRFSNVYFGKAISDYTISQIVNQERNQREQYENQKNKKWFQGGKLSQHRLISDLTIGILGVGTIGKYVARTLNLLGATVWGLSRTSPENKLDYLDRHVTIEKLPEILRACDYIVNVLPSTEQTRGLLNGDVLKHCKDKNSVFINVGRGNVIKEQDLVLALEQGWISAAILDVFEQEPLPETSKLWTLPQVTISPHISGVTRPQSVAELFAENYVRYIKGEEIPNVYDKARGY